MCSSFFIIQNRLSPKNPTNFPQIVKCFAKSQEFKEQNNNVTYIHDAHARINGWQLAHTSNQLASGKIA